MKTFFSVTKREFSILCTSILISLSMNTDAQGLAKFTTAANDSAVEYFVSKREHECSAGLINAGLSKHPYEISKEEDPKTPPVKLSVDWQICGIAITGKITANTVPLVEKAISQFRATEGEKAILDIILDSPGGSVIAAMKIGQVIAPEEAWVYVSRNGQCASACVLIYAAGGLRNQDGPLGIHRPFDYEVSDLPLTYQEYLSRYDEITDLMTSYLAKYGVSPRLVQDMNVIRSDDIRYLSYVEAESYGLGASNIALMEFKKAQKLKACDADFIERRKAWIASQTQNCDNLIAEADWRSCASNYILTLQRLEKNRPAWVVEGDANCMKGLRNPF